MSITMGECKVRATQVMQALREAPATPAGAVIMLIMQVNPVAVILTLLEFMLQLLNLPQYS